MAERATQGRRTRSLAGALAIAFVAVGLGTAAIVVGVVALTASTQSASVAQGGRAETAAAVESALLEAYAAAGDDWAAADLSAAARRASESRAALIVRDQGGARLGVFSPSGQAIGAGGGAGAAPRLPAANAESERIDVIVDGKQVGSAELRFAGAGLTRGEAQLRDALVRAAIVASLAAVLLALAVAAVVTKRLRRPLRHLVGAARALEAGDAGARVQDPQAPGELGEMSVAFDRMADALAGQRAARAAMVSDLAHELRTPLTILRGSLEELLDGDADAGPAELSSLQDEVLRLERLTDDLWALSESEPSFLRLDRQRVDLRAVVAQAAAALDPSARAAGVAIDVSGPPVFVDGDARRLGQVAGNLLVNAIKFTPSGGSVSAQISAADGSATLVVADTGPGIPADELPRVFERFWRGDGARSVGGTGVGLAIVERLVQAHGGTVEAQSPPAGGARFSVRLPLA